MNNSKTPGKSGPKTPKEIGQASRPEAIKRSTEPPTRIIRFKRPKSIKNTFSNLQSRLSQTPRVKQLLALLGLLFLLITIPLTVILVRQRVEYIKRAYPGQPCDASTPCPPGERCVNYKCETIPTPKPTPTPTPVPPTPTPTPEPGFCGTCSPSKSPGWIPGAPGPVDCNGTKCNDGSRNYCCWDDNGDGTCDMCAHGPTPEVECSGTCITFRGMQGQSVKFCEHYASNDVSCPYGISNPNCYTVNIPSNPYRKCIPSNKCGQLEANDYCGVCKPTGCMVAPTPTPTPRPTSTPTPKPTNTPTPRPTPTPTPPTLCLDLTSMAEGPFLQQGQIVTFTCIGSSGIDNPIDHLDFRVQINSGTWEPIGTVGATLMPDGTYQGSIIYTVLTTGVYRFECRVCTTSYCTVWGKAQ